MKNIFIELKSKQEGQAMPEYGLIISLIVLAAIGAVELFGDGVENMYENIKTIVIGALT